MRTREEIEDDIIDFRRIKDAALKKLSDLEDELCKTTLPSYLKPGVKLKIDTGKSHNYINILEIDSIAGNFINTRSTTINVERTSINTDVSSLRKSTFLEDIEGSEVVTDESVELLMKTVLLNRVDYEMNKIFPTKYIWNPLKKEDLLKILEHESIS